jgi:hypothetical protein
MPAIAPLLIPNEDFRRIYCTICFNLMSTPPWRVVVGAGVAVVVVLGFVVVGAGVAVVVVLGFVVVGAGVAVVVVLGFVVLGAGVAVVVGVPDDDDLDRSTANTMPMITQINPIPKSPKPSLFICFTIYFNLVLIL